MFDDSLHGSDFEKKKNFGRDFEYIWSDFGFLLFSALTGLLFFLDIK